MSAQVGAGAFFAPAPTWVASDYEMES